MTRRARKTALLKSYARTWTAFEPVSITEKMREEYPLLKHAFAIYANSRYEVQMFNVPSELGGLMQMVVSRHGNIEDITWEELQRIKIELFGPEREAIEVYPTIADEWIGVKHIRVLWILPTTWQLPFGLHKTGAWGKPA